jgi:hypothetical protein
VTAAARRNRAAAVLCTAFCAAAIGCSAAPPQIVAVEARLEYVHDISRDLRYEQLTVFALVRDEDGFGDIDVLYLLHDESELYWRFDAQSWTHQRRSTEDWIGFSGISTADGSDLPRGLYRLVILDASGERDESRVRIDAAPVAFVSDRVPLVSSDRQTVTIPEGAAVFRLVSTSDDAAPVRDRILAAGEYRVADLLDGANDRVGFLYVVVDDYSGIVSGPFRR